MEFPFPSLDVAAVVITLLGVLYLYLTWNYDYWRKKGIAYEKPELFFGNTRDSVLMKRNLGIIMLDIYRKFQGHKVVGLYTFRQPTLMVRDPELIQKVLVADFSSFYNNTAIADEETDPIMGRNLFVLKDEMWKKSRALITPAFTAGKVKAIFDEMYFVGEELANYLKKHPEEMLLKHTMSRFTTEVVAKCAFGIQGQSFSEEKPVMMELGKTIFEPGTLLSLKFMTFFFAPKLVKILKLKLVSDTVIDFFNKILKDVIVHRQETNEQRTDLVQYLIDVKRKTIEVAKGNITSDIVTRTYTDDDVLAGCVMFFVEGYETSSLTISLVLHQLARHPEVQRKLQAEIDESLKEGKMTYEKIHDLKYLECVISETLRINSPAYNLSKQCTRDYDMDLGDGKTLRIESGTQVIIPVFGLHTDPLYWDDPEAFKPERFSKKEHASKVKGTFLPFGEGPRICIGIRMSSTMMKVGLVNILSQFDIVPTSKTPVKIEHDPKYFMHYHKGGLYARFTPRKF